MSTLNWGILGAGNISSQFVHDLLLNNSRNGKIMHIVRSVGSSSQEKGQKFVDSTGITIENNGGVTPSVQLYKEFFTNKSIDVVYIGTPHPFHRKQAIEALENGKHVLCEKPVTVTGESARELIALAKKKNLFFMEAVWTRFFPSIDLIKKYVFQEKVLGDTKRLWVDFGYDAGLDTLPATSRVRDPKLAGGALLDIGVYNITYARILLDTGVGKNASEFDVKSFQTIDENDGVDYVSSMLFKYKSGKHAILSCTNYSSDDGPFLRLEGTKGKLEIWASNPACPKKFKITFKDGTEPIEYEDTTGYNGFIYEANAVAEDIAQGRIENSTMPWDETLLVMDIMDKVRKDSGLQYPMGIE